MNKTEERLPEDVGKGIDWIDKEIAEYPGGLAQLQIDFPPSPTEWAEFMSEEFLSKHGYEPT